MTKFCPECGSVLTLANVDGDTKFYLCKECLSTWTTDIKDNAETELRRYFFGQALNDKNKDGANNG